jgi:hypothetical protein
VLPFGGLSSPLVVVAVAAMVAAGLTMGGEGAVLLAFPPFLAVAFLILAVVASMVARLAEVDVVIGNDGLRLDLLFGRKSMVRFASLTDLRVEGDQVTLVSEERKQRLYLRPGSVLRGLRTTLAVILRIQKYKSGRAADEAELPDALNADAAYRAGVSLKAAWEDYRARAADAAALETRLRVDSTAAEGYRVGAIGDDELAQAIVEPGLVPKIRIDAARALLRVDPERAVRVAVDAAGATCDEELERQLAQISGKVSPTI